MAEKSGSSEGIYIRQAIIADSPALSRICLVTGNAGTSAEDMHDFDELPGLVYAEPYVHLPGGFGFVLVDPTESNAVVGYIVGAADTRAFEQQADLSWYPRVRERYSHHPSDAATLKSADARYIEILHNPAHAADACITFSPAHLHINILPEYQRQGWGRRLMAHAVDHLRDKALDRVWLGLDPRNVAAQRFYERLGFKALVDAPPGMMCLRFEDFK
ncbi:acyl-CoA N-acyltransferase [Wolfiporia cocos MD-104 SS10]|uniref:Acyl-CoA N-acyltransferase n=1 Tax=Wolfiporia cocos (strain MD-104) TaxID=742152 RepID=A0A2H3JH58_WOLCO|nr:acyl-CoA N-acyltransferase [Wolfiporia cocos MD-104 SS10]